MDDSFILGGIKPVQPKRNRRIVLGFAFVAVAIFGVGFLIGYFVKQPRNQPCSGAKTAGNKESNDFEEFHELFKETISAERLESVIRYDKLSAIL